MTDLERNNRNHRFGLLLKPKLKSKVFEFVFFASMGLITALILLKTLTLPYRWSIFFCLGLSIFFVGLLVQKPRQYILALLILSIQFQASKTFGGMGHFGGSGGLEIQLSDVGLGFLLLIWMCDLGIHNKKIDFFPYITVPAVLFIFAGGMSVLNSSYPQLSLFELIRITKYFLLYLCVANVLRPKEDLPWCINAIVASILIQGLISIFQCLHGGPLGLGILGEPAFQVEVQVLDVNVPRSLGTLAGPNAYGMYVGAIIPIAVSMLFIEIKSIKKLFYITALSVGIVGLILSLCRSQWVILPFVIALVTILSSKNRTSKRRLRRVFVVIAIIAGMTVVCFSSLIKDRLFADYGAATSRLPLARAAIRAITANPIIGMGINTYSLDIRNYDPTNDHAVDIGHPPEAARTMHIFHPVHNIFLLYAAEIGLIGLVFFLWLIYRTYQALFYTIRHRDGLSRAVAIGIIGAFSSLLLHSMLDWSLIWNSLFTLFWLLIGIAANLYRNSKEESVFSSIVPGNNR